jgi:hypothetical protein
MLAHHSWWHEEAIWVFAGVCVTALLAVWNNFAVRHIKRTVDTGNSKDIGTTIHDLDQTIELLRALAHTNTDDTLLLLVKLDQLIEHQSELANYLRDKMDEEKGEHLT